MPRPAFGRWIMPGLVMLMFGTRYLAMLYGFAFFSLHVGDHHLAAVGRQHARRAFAQARSPASHDENLALNVHVSLLR